MRKLMLLLTFVVATTAALPVVMAMELPQSPVVSFEEPFPEPGPIPPAI